MHGRQDHARALGLAASNCHQNVVDTLTRFVAERKTFTQLEVKRQVYTPSCSSYANQNPKARRIYTYSTGGSTTEAIDTWRVTRLGGNELGYIN